MPRASHPLALRTAVLSLLAVVGCGGGDGRLELRVLDETGQPTPARIELVDGRGETYVAEDALTIKIECWTTPLPDWAASVQRTQSLTNPYTGIRQFYVDGTAQVTLPAGRYRLTAWKGIEYGAETVDVDVAPGETTTVELALERWIDLPAEGWVSSDDHIHVSRLSPLDDPPVATWMQAEDIHVANLLRMGTAEHFDITPQYAFGDAGAFREADTLLLAGQEHPRTHVLGHTITLGAEAPIDRRNGYVLYRGFWEDAARLGGASGYAHWRAGNARNGLAIDAPSGLLSFVEVLQFDLPYYDIWYELLNLGVRIAPTAGTDFPCIPSVPGRERFYTRVETQLSRASFVEGIRRGRTFVTNGPILDFDVGGVGIGGELALDEPGSVRVRGRVRFDPARDDVRRLELVRNGETVASATPGADAGEIVLDISTPVEGPGWLALRAEGMKHGELPLETPWYLEPSSLEWGCRFGCGASMLERAEYVGTGRPRPSAAHTGPVYVTVAGAGIMPDEALLRRILARLDDLEARLADGRLEELLVLRPFPGTLLIDGVPAKQLRRDRPALVALIGEARAHYRGLLPDTSAN